MSLFPLNLIAGTFIEAPLSKVLPCLHHWANGHPAEQDLRARRKRTPFAQAIGFLEPRFFTPDRGLLVSHASGWTAFFDNHLSQFQPGAELFVLCDRLKTRTCYLYHCPGNDGAAGTLFAHHQPESETGVAIRSLWLANESRWRFIATGEPLSFERAETYTSKRVRDRLTPE